MRRVLHSSSLDIRHQLFHARQVRHSCEERRSDEVPPRDRRARAASGPDFGADLAPIYADLAPIYADWHGFVPTGADLC